jgi:hypothetical protein
MYPQHNLSYTSSLNLMLFKVVWFFVVTLASCQAIDNNNARTDAQVDHQVTANFEVIMKCNNYMKKPAQIFIIADFFGSK